MAIFIHDLINKAVALTPNKTALICNQHSLNYSQLNEQVIQISNAFQSLKLQRHSRIGIYLNKTIPTVTTMLAASKSQLVFVPLNPILKASQVSHIVNDCDIEILFTNKVRFNNLKPTLSEFPSLRYVIIIDNEQNENFSDVTVIGWKGFIESNTTQNKSKNLPASGSEISAILYTSGSTGKPKGVVLSHQNIVLGAQSVASYLNNSEDDNILASLPLSFDYGLSQVTTSFSVGATCVLLDYLIPQDVLKTIEKHKITGLAAVPPLWSQLCKLDWKKYKTSSMRYFTNSGGALTQTNLSTLRKVMPQAEPYLMYGLTEAFRSTYLPPSDIDKKPGAIGKAVPNAEVLVINAQGDECQPNVPGELVHIGPLVSLGYWNDIEKTQQRFKPSPKKLPEIIQPDFAVWSGDTVVKDEDGYLFFVARQDEMIKTSGYRVSPMEVEEILYQHPAIIEAAVIGAKHADLGQCILVVLCSNSKDEAGTVAVDISKHCQQKLPAYMVPHQIIVLDDLPHNANGKIDRSKLNQQYQNYFMGCQ